MEVENEAGSSVRKSVQRDMDGKDTVVEPISPGTSHEKG